MRKYLIFLIVLAMLLTFTGCKSRAKTLLDGDCIRITQEGAKIAIYDVEGGVTYTFSIYATKTRQNGLQSLIRRLIRRPCESKSNIRNYY